MRQSPGEPADRDTLHPHADQRNGVASRVDAIIPVREGQQNFAKPTGKQAIAEARQEYRNPCVGRDRRNRTARLNSAAITPVQSRARWAAGDE